MKYTIIAKTGTKRPESVLKGKNGELVVNTNSRPIGGEANSAIISLLANYFKVSKTNIKIISGVKSKRKIIEVQNMI